MKPKIKQKRTVEIKSSGQINFTLPQRAYDANSDITSLAKVTLNVESVEKVIFHKFVVNKINYLRIEK